MIRLKKTAVLPVIDLDGPEGNAFVLLGYAKSYAKQSGYSDEMVVEILEKMKFGDYYNLIKTFEEYFGDFVVLETKNKKLLAGIQ